MDINGRRLDSKNLIANGSTNLREDSHIILEIMVESTTTSQNHVVR